MEAVYVTPKWKWNGCGCEWDLKFVGTADTVFVSSIDEVPGSCIIDEVRALARMKLFMKRNPTIQVDLDAAFTCQTESTYSLSGEGIVSYRWSVSGDGASFKQGTNVVDSSVVVQSNSDRTVRFTVMCEVNNILQVYQEFKHQRWIADALVPTGGLFPSDELMPGNTTIPEPVVFI